MALVAGERDDALLHLELMHLVLELADAALEALDLVVALELALARVEDADDAREVDALVGELVDEVQALDVGLAVEARVAAAAAR